MTDWVWNIYGIILSRESWSSRRKKKTLPIPLVPPKIPHGLAQYRIWTSAVRRWRITFSTTALPLIWVKVKQAQKSICSHAHPWGHIGIYIIPYKKNKTLYRPNHKGKSKSKVAPVHAVMAYEGRGSIAPLILDLNTGLKLVVNLMLWPLFPKQRALVPSKQEAVCVPEPIWDVLENRNISFWHWDSIFQTLS